ncbi:MAG TPA: hypothetical protein DCY61_02300 [Dehalococcoidia bacterium]|nr:hypothetical protein [Dehalococcoidia bacterium]
MQNASVITQVRGVGGRRSVRPEFAVPSMCFQVKMEDLMPIHIRYGDKNRVLSQRLDISPIAPKTMLYLQASYTAIAAVFGMLCGSI